PRSGHAPAHRQPAAGRGLRADGGRVHRAELDDPQRARGGAGGVLHRRAVVRIAGVQAGKVQRRGALRTAFGKTPVNGPVRVFRENLEGDAQADHRYHGGPERAVLAYGADPYPLWRAELSWPDLPLGGFGGDLQAEGLAADAAG